MTRIPIEVKKECLRLKTEGKKIREIYDEYYTHEVKTARNFNTFRRLLQKWSKSIYPDDFTLECGTYEGFTAHNATVQVSKSGEIVQAWVRQTVNEVDLDELVKSLKEEIKPYEWKSKNDPDANRMLEIPLFDMHWGISFFDHYEPVLKELLFIINSRHWDRIVIPFGQDYFHNDSIVNGITTKGTHIEKVDMARAVKEGKTFITSIIDAALENANEVKVFYTPGNHDRSVSWMFMQVLLERYGAGIVDDNMAYRKVFVYGKNSIMVTHGNSKRATAKNLAHIFAVSFPEEFAQATTREVHAGHLHHEEEGDIFGVMIRRLSSGAAVDDWSDREDYIGSHRRFTVYEYYKESLRSIHYV